ncbi:MAG TPA: hypothetical protein VHV77_14185, partial [Pirellulales bacterium]|nr:hypothetical protein [Pirellulales bacterium]
MSLRFAMVVGLCFVSSLLPADVRAADDEQLQGSWEMTSLSLGGQEIPIEEIRSKGIRDGQLMFESGNLKLELLESSQTLELPYTLDETKEQKEIDIRSPDNKLR